MTSLLIAMIATITFCLSLAAALGFVAYRKQSQLSKEHSNYNNVLLKLYDKQKSFEVMFVHSSIGLGILQLDVNL